MDISLRVTKDFERCLDDLKKKYGEDFEYINGLHPSQLDFSEFLENMVKDGYLSIENYAKIVRNNAAEILGMPKYEF